MLQAIGHRCSRYAAEAKVLFAQYRQQLLQHQVLSQNNIVPVPLKQLAEEHLAQVAQHQARSWLVKQRNYLKNYILPFFGPTCLSTDVVARAIERYVEKRRSDGVKATTANKRLSCIKALFRFAERRHYVLSSPAKAVTLLRDDSDVHSRLITYEECLKLVCLAGTQRPGHGRRSHQFNEWPTWIMLACHTGLRPGEQATLEFADIDLHPRFPDDSPQAAPPLRPQELPAAARAPCRPRQDCS